MCNVARKISAMGDLSLNKTYDNNCSVVASLKVCEGH
jgi:hypothetical protein